MTMHHRASAGVIALALAMVATATASATPSPSTLILHPAQIGPGYVLKMRPDSRGVTNTVTLDMCGTTFRSETRRTARLQVDYEKPGTQLGISNEVVTYRPGWAARAMTEIRRSVANCPHAPVSSTIAGVGPITYRITRLHNTHRLLPGAIVLLVHVSGTAGGHHVDATSAVVYETRGDILSGVYGKGRPLAQQIALTLHAAAASATNLRTK